VTRSASLCAIRLGMDEQPYRFQTQAQQTRSPFVLLAAIGAGLASVYWAFMTVIMGLALFSPDHGSASPSTLLVPCLLIALYAWRGVQIYQGDSAALNRILLLHGLGAVVSVIQFAAGGPVMWLLQGIKIAIHVFGLVSAFLARRALFEKT
jgi:hypothetical protein